MSTFISFDPFCTLLGPIAQRRILTKQKSLSCSCCNFLYWLGWILSQKKIEVMFGWRSTQSIENSYWTRNLSQYVMYQTNQCMISFDAGVAGPRVIYTVFPPYSPTWLESWILGATINICNNLVKYKVNRCLARYSPRATTTKRPTNRPPNKPAWPGPNWPKNPIFGQIWSFLGKKSFFYWRNQKFCYPHNGKPT